MLHSGKESSAEIPAWTDHVLRRKGINALIMMSRCVTDIMMWEKWQQRLTYLAGNHTGFIDCSVSSLVFFVSSSLVPSGIAVEGGYSHYGRAVFCVFQNSLQMK